MPVPGSINDLSPTPSQNSPQGSEPVGSQANEYIQALSAFVRQLADGKVNNGTLDAPKGTRIVLQQATAPAGWTVDADPAFTDCAVRFNQSVGRQNGTVGWSGWNWGGQFAVDGHQLTVAEMPSHGHGVSDPGHSHGVSDPGHSHGVNDPGHSHSIAFEKFNISLNDIGMGTWTGGRTMNGNTDGSGTGIWLSTSGTGIGIYGSGTNIGIQANGGNAAHNHTYRAPQVKYADCIVAVKQ
ncbi:hypothetical protein [Burkholderia multivorans]|uniref:hypothetical protein n=1 Tax=Burkholderia multivorans TaxID=87883 RepID=UPI0020185ED6|nr:hypothetical protein [Burkholderia multivorans]MCL4651637.1 hypothetical protein [Burkholderia multivorans]MCL4655140.1 hypothetical protein [Burkholderia multivorans]MCO1426143.1 hypothetical protein [Burkholderia multivorans]UQN51196.1 hypothetical protein L0Y88_09015 [Burkholderia multivorans]UQN84453.1 hypothetical protein L0Z18_19585 [Burkholderia multivorans]